MVLTPILEGYDSDVYISEGSRVHKLYRKLRPAQLARYHGVQNSLVLADDGYHEFALDQPEQFGSAPWFQTLKFRVLRLPEPELMARFSCVETRSRRPRVATEPEYVPGPDLFAYLVECHAGIERFVLVEAYARMRALCVSIDAYFLRTQDVQTSMVGDNIKVESLENGILTLVITDIAGSVECCLELNSRRIEALLAEREVA